MVILWITLLFLHRGNSLVPVKTVHVGETATLTCVLPNEELGSRKVQWYKQRVGDTLKLLVSLSGKPSSEFFQSRFSAHNSKDFSNLTIWNVAQEDEGMYHCGIDTWIKLEWSGTYLLVKGNTERTSNYIVVQQPTESNPLRPGDTATLQCSVLTNSENNTCSGHHNVFWFRDGSNKSLPNIIYTHGNRTDQCEKRSDPQDGCVYRFSKNVGSSDAGTYYCAVATCGEILFGNGTTLDVQESSASSQTASTVVFVLCAVMGINLIVTAVLIYLTKKTNNSDHKAPVLQKNLSDQKRQQIKDTQMFSAVVFAVMEADICNKKDAKAAEKQQIYTAIKAFGLD
ncbi:uncharacterized protein LOC113017917 [Astatotilapia calliptera]|uniref:uncharacterized protein LOC113017917 n=1 Tax=Astatotilapia calliptera TaxID=8154 RepID=UPI000E4026C8|nr:uncharacterized protein LOC113017917 [Astatotilapia calliptera]